MVMLTIRALLSASTSTAATARLRSFTGQADGYGPGKATAYLPWIAGVIFWETFQLSWRSFIRSPLPKAPAAKSPISDKTLSTALGMSRPNNRSAWTRLRRDESSVQDAIGDLQVNLEKPVQVNFEKPDKPWRKDMHSRVSRIINNGRIQFSVMRANADTHIQVSKPWYVINPDRCPIVSIWQVAVAVALLFVAVVTPVQVALLEPEFNGLFIAGVVVDAMFVIDLALQFFTAYSRTLASGRVWEVRPRRIWAHYFRSLRLVKLLRLMKASKVLQDFEAPLSIPYQQLALVKFMMVLGFICHWLACCWAMTLRIVDSHYPRWIDGVQDADASYGINTIDSPARVYLAAFYFCSYTITSVGYGDIGPQNILERGVCSGIILVAGLAWAYIIGEVGTIVADMTSEGQEFRRTMQHLNAMMRDQRLPFRLQCRVRRFFLQNRTQTLFVARQSLLTRMSPQLQAEVSVMTNMHWLEKVSFMRDFMTYIRDQGKTGAYTAPYESCVAEIARSLTLTAFAQQETFENVQVLYILSRGLVALNSRVGGLGEVWGEDFVLSDTSLVRPVSGYALTYLEILSLTRTDFVQDGVIECYKNAASGSSATYCK
ncbi:Potassium voltage-gated channel subfamily H member 6 [Symbiodinium microadriaticum]|uniref:Potassium voltage-gated channel subfamily H member 6 n=1 Tax=Symbiodinium microadriaticum TaxID=2951 RepID=A0A1Q9DP33_SYMMI|nr:Potassium voltage-gated channel subfamily H member 6 [Symbiodinium microadriaticum]